MLWFDPRRLVASEICVSIPKCSHQAKVDNMDPMNDILDISMEYGGGEIHEINP